MIDRVYIWSVLGIITFVLVGFVSIGIAAQQLAIDTTPAVTPSPCAPTPMTVRVHARDTSNAPIPYARVRLSVVGSFAPVGCPPPTALPLPVFAAAAQDDGFFAFDTTIYPDWLYQLEIQSPDHETYVSPPVNGAYLPLFQHAQLQLNPHNPRIFG